MPKSPKPQERSSFEAPKSNSTTEWTTHWLEGATKEQKEKWILGIPQFKYCKKRKEFFSEDFFDVWYKAPYKYHMRLTAKNLGDTSVMASLDVTYEDGQKINSKEEVVSKTENYFVATSGKDEYEVKLGSFQFNVCSYKHDGRKFRLVVYLYVPGSDHPSCGMVSPPFTIKAKKPISKPGIKSKKRRREETLVTEPLLEKKQQFMIMPQFPIAKRTKQEMVNPIPQCQQQVPTQMVQQNFTNLQTPAFDFLESLKDVEIDTKPSFDTLALDDFVQSFGSNPYQNFVSCVDPYQQMMKVPKQEDLSMQVSPLCRVDTVLSAFEAMNEKDRKQIICKLIEKCHASEKEFLNRKYFSNENYLAPQLGFVGLPIYGDSGIHQPANVAQYFA